MAIQVKKKVRPAKSAEGITGKGFEFVSGGHSYYLDGKRMTGVTTILGVIAKPQLIPWAAKMATEFISQAIAEGKEITPELLVLAKNAHAKKKTDAGEAGTDVHAIIERIIKDSMEHTGGIINPTDISQDKLVAEQVRHFVSWAVSNNVKFVASEEKVFSRELFTGGTIDFLCEIDGETWIGDIKTSSAIYPEHFFQTAGYQKLMEDMAKTDMGMQVNVKGHVILNCRKDGTFEEKRSVSNEDNLLAFMSAYNLYRVQEKLKGNVI